MRSIPSQAGALFEITGEISANVTWDESIYFVEAGVPMDISDLAFELQFRCSANDESAITTLSTTGGELVVTDDDDGNPTILRINVAYTALNDLDGDYVADLVSKDSDDKLLHWASGIVTFRNNPLAF